MRALVHTAAPVLALALAGLAPLACGGSPPPAAESPEPADESSAAEPAPADESAAVEPADETTPADEEAGPEPPAATDKLKGRDITYRPTSAGLVIEVEGVKLEPTPQMKPKAGGHQLTLAVRVTSTDGKLHRLLKSKKGVLMVAGELDKGGGKKERFTDDRTGDAEAEEVVGPDDSIELTQVIEPPVYGNQSLTLHVGLWGLGREADERRPLKRLFIVKVVPGSRKPTAVIVPPD